MIKLNTADIIRKIENRRDELKNELKNLNSGYRGTIIPIQIDEKIKGLEIALEIIKEARQE